MMRKLIDLVESLAGHRVELEAPEVGGGWIDIHWLGETLGVPNPLTFNNAMRKILMNQSELMNDFEIIEISRAFINFVGMSTEDSIRVSMRLGLITKTHASQHQPSRQDEEPENEVPK